MLIGFLHYSTYLLKSNSGQHSMLTRILYTYVHMQIPEKGFYYHYKHDESKGFNHHAYEIVGTGKHTEDESIFVVYRPLYENDLSPQNYYLRPIELFF